MRFFYFVLLIGLLPLACTNENTFDPTAIKSDGFRGITYTNEVGDIVGPVDKTDWRFHPGYSQYEYLPQLTNIEISPTACDSIPIDGRSVLPYRYAIRPASPNPFEYCTAVIIELPTATNYSVVIINENQQIVYDQKGYQEAGYFRFVWTGIDRFGNEATDGIYRVIFVIEVQNNIGDDINIGGFGDIWLKRNQFVGRVLSKTKSNEKPDTILE